MQIRKIMNFIFVLVIIHLFPITKLANYLIQPNKVYAQQKKTPQQIQNERLLSLARSYEQSGLFAQSLELYQRLWRDEPQNVIYYRGVRQSFINLKQPDQALAVGQKMLASNPSPMIEADLGDAYYKLGQEKHAFSAWDNMIQKSPKNKSIYQIVASAMLSNRLYEDAIKIYERGRAALKDNKVFIIEMAHIYQARMEYQKAILLYLEYLDHDPGQYVYVEQNIAGFASDPELIGEVEKILIENIKKNPNKIEIRNLLAALYMRSANYQSALQEFSLIDEYVVTRPDHEKQKVGSQLFNFAQNAFNDGKFEFAIQAYTLLLSRYPDSPYSGNSKYGMANAYENTGDFARAIEMYQEIINTYQKSPLAKQSYFRIGEIKLDQFSLADEAESYFQEVLKIPVNVSLNFDAMFRIGDCYIQQGAFDRARNWYNQLATRYGASDDVEKKALLKLGKIDYWAGNFDGASKYFDRIRNEPVNITDDRAGFYVNDALEFMIFIEENKQSQEQLKQFARGSLFVEQKQYEKALEIFYEITQHRKPDPLEDDTWLKIGQLEYRLGRYQNALTAFQNVIQNYPESVHCDLAQKMIGEIYEVGLKDFSRAQQAYEVVLTSYPNSVLLEEVRKRIRGLERGNRVIR